MGWVVDVDERGFQVVELAGAGNEIPRHHGEIWIEDEEINVSFGAIENIEVADRAPLRIDSHVVSFPADVNGIAAAEAILRMRKRLMQAGNEHLLVTFAEKGDDRSKILAVYEWMFSQSSVCTASQLQED